MLFDALVLAGGRSSRLGGTPKAGLEVAGRSLLATTVASVVARGARRVVVVGEERAIAELLGKVEGLGEAELFGEADGFGEVGAPGEVDRLQGRSGEPPPVEVLVAREVPEFGGPAAGIAAGFAALEAASEHHDSDFVLVLACDVPVVDAVVAALVSAGGDTVGAETAVAVPNELMTAGDEVSAAVAGADGMVAGSADGHPQHLLGLYRTPALRASVARHREAGDLDGLAVRTLVAGLDLAVVPVPAGVTDDVDTWADAERLGIARPSGPESGATPAGGARPGGSGGADATGAPGVETATGAREAGGATSGQGTRPDVRRPSDDAEQAAELRAWVDRLAEELGHPGLEVDLDDLLGLAGVAAHAVRRPAAPLTTFVVGYAAGRAVADGGDARSAAEHASAVARALAARWRGADGDGGDGPTAAVDRKRGAGGDSGSAGWSGAGDDAGTDTVDRRRGAGDA